MCHIYQVVAVDWKKSTSPIIKSDIPQGSVLEPILFVLFINNLHDDTSSDIHWVPSYLASVIFL